ncbi:MAG: hypothetical protein AAB131_10010 [Actinomycetota bacterium]
MSAGRASRRPSPLLPSALTQRADMAGGRRLGRVTDETSEVAEVDA